MALLLEVFEETGERASDTVDLGQKVLCNG